MDLSNISIEDLEKEIEKRKNVKIYSPKIKSDIDYSRIISETESHVGRVLEGTAREDDDHYIYETVMETIYGKEYWEWHNTHNR